MRAALLVLLALSLALPAAAAEPLPGQGVVTARAAGHCVTVEDDGQVVHYACDILASILDP